MLIKVHTAARYVTSPKLWLATSEFVGEEPESESTASASMSALVR